MIKNSHQPEELLWWDCCIDSLVAKEIIHSFDQKQLKNAFHDDLLENSPTFATRWSNLNLSLFGNGRGKGGRNNSRTIRI
jgi:hypothetical protein